MRCQRWCLLLLLLAPLAPANADQCLAPPYRAGVSTTHSLEAAYPLLPAMTGLLQLDKAPGEKDSWYAVSQQGLVWRFQDRDDADALTPVLDWSERVESFGEAGLLGLAFHPAFDSGKRLAYLYYSPSANLTRLSSVSVSDEGTFRDNSEQVLLEFDQPHINHNGGSLAFGPDGYLYLSLGDGGGGDDRFGNGQDTHSLLSSVLRLDVDGGSPYAIPKDNPFADGVGGRPELFAWGLRNTWRFSFDPATGDLWGGDVGQREAEEINLIEKGGNYGWPLMEGSQCRQDCSDTLRAPRFTYSHSDGNCAVIGGLVYRGSTHRELRGHYLFGDFCSGRVMAYDPQLSTMNTLALSGFRISAFARDDDSVLVLNLDGGAGNGIYRLRSGGIQSAPVPEKLSQQPCFSGSNKEPSLPAASEYHIATPAWNNGLSTRYFYSIPDGELILPGFGGDLLFPPGSVLIKNLYAGDHIVETQLLMHHYTGWAGYNYLWREDREDADLVHDGRNIETSVGLHRVSGPGECTACHNPVTRGVIGADIAQLGSFSQDGMTGLDQLDQAKLLGFADYIPATMSKAMAPVDQDRELQGRARSYLHSNCSSCHRPGGSVAGLDLRAHVSLAATGACNTPPTQSDLGIDGARLLAPGKPEQSLLFKRMTHDGPGRMPPLGVGHPDIAGAKLIHSWISTMRSCTE